MRKTVLNNIFLDLRKTYDSLDREECIDILVGYEVGPRKTSILQMYWVQIHMAVNAGGNYGPAFQSQHEVNQEYPLSPTIFNLVVDAFIQH